MKRDRTMRRALDLLDAGAVIVETGTARQADDGHSTLVFGEWTAEHAGHLWTVDIDADTVASAEILTFQFSPVITYVCGDSVAFLTGFDQGIDLLYLDSHDYPYGDLLDLYGGKTDLNAAIASLVELSEAEILAAHGDLIAPSQRHAEREVMAALPHLSDHAAVLIDDAGLPGGGKARLARAVLAQHGFACIADEYQTLWAR